MLINHNQQYIFVHIPKTGGSTVAAWLPGDGHEVLELPHWHATLSDISSVVDITQFYTFAVIRNPFDRLYSMYTFCVGLIDNLKKHPLYYANGINHFAECDFKTWLMECNSWAGWDTDRRYLPAQIEQQCDYLLLNGEISVDMLARFECFEEHMKIVCNDVNIPFSSLPHHNKSHRSQQLNSVYDSEMIDFVLTHHVRDLELFNYGVYW